MDRRCLSHDTFMQRCRQKHGDRFDYSLTRYTTSRTPVTIVCRVHGPFQQMPSDHTYRGQGCKKCATAATRRTTEDFVKEARSIHGDEYDYSQVTYTGAHKKVIVVCRKHGEFCQIPINHTRLGAGCPGCWNERRNISPEYFKKRCLEVHGDYYDFSHSKSGAHLDMTTVKCRLHGPFEILTNYLLSGMGCPKCAGVSSSKPCMEWLDTVAELDGVYISHAGNDGAEFRIPGTRYHADGYASASKTVYEFHGDYFHGNPRKYTDPTLVNKKAKRTMGDLYDRTCQRTARIQELGYRVEEMWEDEWTCVQTLARMQADREIAASDDTTL